MLVRPGLSPRRARRAPDARRSRGVTLIEVMVVVTILGLLSTAVAFAVFPQGEKAKRDATLLSARALRVGADAYRLDHPDECPTPERLRAAEIIDRGASVLDAWKSPFTIVCEERASVVVSAGPDRRAGTEDDLRVPPPG